MYGINKKEFRFLRGWYISYIASKPLGISAPVPLLIITGSLAQSLRN